jgi:3alpha(or 20beta)-hydroxysteroid dehydrogenase
MTVGGATARLTGRVAIVTGAARGIGAAIVRCFVDNGAVVLATDIIDDEGAALVDGLGEAARYRHLDVRDRRQWEQAVASAREAFGAPATILVHNAGVMTPGSVTTTREPALDLAFGVNVYGPVIGTQVCTSGMIEAGGGAVIVVSSLASVTVGPGFIPYALSKAANAMYARAAARELGEFGIRVNSLHPGGVQTPMNSGPDFAALDKDAWFGLMTIPRIGQPEEIANAALFLASDESSYVTGTQLVVDGGQQLGPRSAWKS